MNSSAGRNLATMVWSMVVACCLSTWIMVSAQQSSTAKTTAASAPSASTSAATSSSAPSARGFDTPQHAAAALIDAAGKFEVDELIQIFGPGGDEIVLTGEYPEDRQRAFDFAREAHEKTVVSVDPKNGNRAFLLVGLENWPFPVPMVKRAGQWYFDAKAGRAELLYRRVGENELEVIAMCHGYVKAQHEFAYRKRQGYNVNQYAQHIISPAGAEDGLAWQNPDGTWGGPLGEKAAQAIAQGYSRGVPYNGYFFKVLKGQGPAAPLGEMDFVVKGVMIGGFALAATPAEYRVTGVKTFIVSHDGVVYQKDFGPASLQEFKKMDRYNPDRSWTPVQEDQQP